MKPISLFLLTGCIFLFFSCNRKKEKTVEHNPVQSEWMTKGEDLFLMEITPLPVSQEDLRLLEESVKTVPASAVSSYFPDSFFLSSFVKIVRIPDQLGFLLFLVVHTDEQRGEMTDLCCFSSGMDFQDNLRVFSRDSVPGSSLLIYQTYWIDEDGKIRTTKQLAEVLIEELYYQLNGEGNFEEIRDGKTPVVAFESFDHINYFIESFVWKYDSNGGLYKEDPVKTSYRLVNGEMKPTE